MRPLRPADFLLVLAALSVSAMPVRAAVDCGCGATGGYISPLQPASLTANSNGSSPSGKYSLTTFANGGSIQITIFRTSPASQVLSMSIPNSSAWGFSPDDDRFSYHSLNGSIETVQLFDLTSATPSAAIWTQTSNPVSSKTLFSPNGQYLLYVSANATPQTFLWIVDARTGALRFQQSPLIHVVSGSGEDSFGFQTWGFSPDPEDRSFVFATVLGQQQIELELANLSLPSASARVIDNSTLMPISGFWQFSPCGDRLGLVVQPNPTQVITSLYKTSDGSKIVEQTNSFAAVAFSSTAASQIATIGGTPYMLAPNTAGASCPAGPGLQSFALSPGTVNGGSSSTGTVTLTSAATGSGVVVPLVIPAQTYVSGPPSVKVLAGQTSASFTISTTTVPSVIKVVIDASFSGVHRTDSLTVQPAPPPPAVLVAANAGDVTGGVSTILGLVLDRAAPAGGATVALSSNDARVTVPASATIPAGQQVLGVIFNTPVTQTDFAVAITSSYHSVVLVDTLHVLGPRITILTTHDVYCLPSDGTISVHTQINGTAPTGGMSLALTCSDPAHLSVPASVVIPAGFSGWNFDVTALTAAAEWPVTITETLNGVSMSILLTVVPPSAWHATNLGSADFGTYPTAVNDVDLVVGFDRYSGNDLAFVWDDGFRSPLPLLSGTVSASANAINHSGIVVGQSGTHAFRYDYNTDAIIDLAPSTSFARANGINDAGVIVGRNGAHAFRWDGAMQDLGTLGGPTSEAMAINAGGEIVGKADAADSTQRAFRWTTGGGLQALALPAGMTRSKAIGINASGVIIGTCSNASGTFGCQWVGGVPAVLDSAFTPLAIDDAGDMVGPRDGHLVLSGANGITRLDIAISPSCGWDHGMTADGGGQMGMNSLGHIAGASRLGGNDYFYGYLIAKDPGTTSTPPPPAGGAAVALAVGPLGANPARGRIRLRCALPRALPATLEILDIMGRHIAERSFVAAPPGVRFIEVPETDPLHAGVYFARLRQGSVSATTRIVLVR